MENSVAQKTQTLVALAQAGDRSALGQLWQIFGTRLHWMMRVRMGGELRSKLESMDLVQDAVVAALEGLENFTHKRDGDFLRWLSTIAENRLRDNLDRLHARKRDMRREVRLDRPGSKAGGGVGGFAGPIEATTPSVIMSKKEEFARLAQAIDQLRPEHREVIVMAKIEGLSYKAIGQRLNKSPDAVGMTLSRAMVALSGVFEDN